MRIGIKIKPLLIILILSSVIFADLTFNVSAASTRIGIDDYLTLNLIFEGTDADNIASPKLPPSMDKDWKFINSTSSTSTNISLINGKMESSKKITYQYFLRPLKKGTFTIPALQFNHKGKSYKSKAFRVSVVDGSVKSSNSRTSRNTRSNPRQQQTSRSSSGESASDYVFLAASANKNSVYVGEPVIITYNLYSRVNLVQASMSQDAAHPGFWAEDLFSASSLDWKNQVIKGQTYRVAPIKKLVLYPASTGKKTTEPMEITGMIQQRGRSIFDFFGTTEQVKIKNKPITINVLPLPTNGKPADFSGAVGDFTISMTADQTSCPADNAIGVSVKISGTGNLNAIEELKPNFPDFFEIYGENNSDRVLDAASSRREKRFDYVVIPRESGQFEIPALSFSYFDPGSKKYKRASSGNLALDISPGEGKYPTGTGSSPINNDVISKGTDINFIMTDIPLMPPNPDNVLAAPGYAFLLILILEIIAIGASLAIRKNKLKLVTDNGYARFVNAQSFALSRIKKAKPQSKDYITEIAEALDAYIGDKLNSSFGEAGQDTVFDRLTALGVVESTVSEIKDFRAELDIARFAPGATSLDTDSAKSKAIDFIKELEKTIKPQNKA